MLIEIVVRTRCVVIAIPRRRLGAAGVGVRNLPSSRNINASGSSGTSQAPQKLPQTLSLVKALEKADLKVARKSILVTFDGLLRQFCAIYALQRQKDAHVEWLE